MKGVERWLEQWAKVKQPWPHPQVEAFSYWLVMPCHRYCSLLVWESIPSRLWYSASCKNPWRPRTGLSSSHPLCFSLRKSFLVGSCQERNDLGMVELRKRVEKWQRMLPAPHLPLSSPSHTPNPFCFSNFPSFRSSSPFHQPVTRCAGKSDFLFSLGSKLKAQPSWRVRSHILGLSADPQEPASPLRRHETLSLVQQKTRLTLCHFLLFSPHLQVPRKSWVIRTQTHLGGFHWKARCVCQCSEGLLPIESHVSW